MPKFAPNKMPLTVKTRYYELIRRGMKGAAAARLVGVSTSCGSLWFIEAGSERSPVGSARATPPAAGGIEFGQRAVGAERSGYRAAPRVSR